MKGLTRWFVVMAMGVTLLSGLTHCVVVPAPPVAAGYEVAPPVVVVRPYRPYHHYRPYRYYRPYHPYYGWYPSHPHYRGYPW
jgi:hypothetical protein